MNMTKEIRISPNDGSYNAFTGLLFTHSKKLIAAYRTGTSHGVSVPAYIDLAISSDMGNSWSISRVIQDESIDFRDPRLAQLADGTILLSVQASEVGPRIYKSTDDGTTFTLLYNFTADFAVNTHFGFGRVVEDNNGKLYFGIYDYSGSNDIQKIAVSSDAGVSWSSYEVLNEPTTDNNEMAFCFIPSEKALTVPNSVYLAKSKGIIIGIGRVSIGQSPLVFSDDEGQTWEKFTPAMGFNAHGADLVYKEGKLILSYRDGGGSPTVSVSEDLGFTWSKPLFLSSRRGGYCQSALIGNGIHGVTYYTDGGGAFGTSDPAVAWFRFIRPKFSKEIKYFRFWDEVNPVNAGSNAFRINTIHVDMFESVSVLLQSDAAHDKSVTIRWSFDGKTNAFEETISAPTTSYLYQTLEKKAPYITGGYITNNDSVQRLMNWDFICRPK